MDHNFGVIEVASARTVAAPGWAYVPDTSSSIGAAAAASAAAGGNRKRAARNQGPTVSASDLGARQEARVRKELEALDRDCQRDANVTIPVRNPASRVQAKHTPNVRKILLSQKTFANHLDDFHAMQALAETQPGHANQYTYLAKGQEAPSTKSRRTNRRQSQSQQQVQQQLQQQQQQQQQDTEMEDANGSEPTSLLAPPPPEEHPYPEEDTNPLLASRVPPPPTDEEIRRLLLAPPLSYTQAAARWPEDPDDGTRYPVRRFCEICGYWARVKCVKCGGRVCALDCMGAHKEECITRYGL